MTSTTAPTRTEILTAHADKLVADTLSVSGGLLAEGKTGSEIAQSTWNIASLYTNEVIKAAIRALDNLRVCGRPKTREDLRAAWSRLFMGPRA